MHERLAKAVREAAKWYLRRRRLVRVLIFTAIFVAPIMVYSYTRVPPASILIEKYGTAYLREENISLPTVNIYNILGGHSIYYIGNFEYINIYRINTTHYLYTYPQGIGLLIVVNETANPLFVLTDKYNISIRVNGKTYNISRVTLVLPPAPPTSTLPFKTIICMHVSNYTTYYDAFMHHTLPATYLPACGRQPK